MQFSQFMRFFPFFSSLKRNKRQKQAAFKSRQKRKLFKLASEYLLFCRNRKVAKESSHSIAIRALC
jgi:hypothetical protein